VSEEDRMEWLEALHEVHKYSLWFKDRKGIIFSFLWYSSLKEGR
jgi:hypothetical protein